MEVRIIEALLYIYNVGHTAIIKQHIIILLNIYLYMCVCVCVHVSVHLDRLYGG